MNRRLKIGINFHQKKKFETKKKKDFSSLSKIIVPKKTQVNRRGSYFHNDFPTDSSEISILSPFLGLKPTPQHSKSEEFTSYKAWVFERRRSYPDIYVNEECKLHMGMGESSLEKSFRKTMNKKKYSKCLSDEDMLFGQTPNSPIVKFKHEKNEARDNEKNGQIGRKISKFFDNVTFRIGKKELNEKELRNLFVKAIENGNKLAELIITKRVVDKENRGEERKISRKYEDEVKLMKNQMHHLKIRNMQLVKEKTERSKIVEQLQLRNIRNVKNVRKMVQSLKALKCTYLNQMVSSEILSGGRGGPFSIFNELDELKKRRDELQRMLVEEVKRIKHLHVQKEIQRDFQQYYLGEIDKKIEKDLGEKKKKVSDLKIEIQKQKQSLIYIANILIKKRKQLTV